MFREARWVGNGRSIVLLLALCVLLWPMAVAGAAETYALQFDRVDDYVDIGPWPGISSQVMTHPVTFECWLKSANTTDVLTLLGVVNTSDSMFFRITLNMDGMRVAQPGGIKLLQRDAAGAFFRGGTASSLNTAVTNGEWHHMALAFDPETGDLAIYVDGISQALSFQNVAAPTNMSDFEHPIVTLGARSMRGSVDQFFEGSMGEVRIWDYVRSGAEIEKDMGTALPGQPEGLIGYWPFNEGEGTTAFDRSGHGRDGILVGPTWTTDAAPVIQPFAFLPIPADGAFDVPRELVLSWTARDVGQRHNIYLGDSLADVSAAEVGNPLGVLVAQDQAEVQYTPLPGRLQFGQTYYWRVDDAAGDSKGAIWSFTVEPVGYVLDAERITAAASSWNSDDEGPEKTVDGSGLDLDDGHSAAATDMWLSGSVPPGESAWIQYELDNVYALHQMRVWNHNTETESLIGFGIKEAIVEHSLDGTAWTALDDPQEFDRATGRAGYATTTTVDLRGAVARYVRITAVSNWGGLLQQYGLSEVQFLYIPVSAGQPDPPSGATDLAPELTLSWRAGRQAVAHDVYLSTDRQAVIDETAPVVAVSQASFDPGALDLGTTYYWKVNEVNEANDPSIWRGDLWNFTTQEYFLVDDFESYTDDEGDRIYEAWVDGWENDTGSTVGYLDAPFAERTIVHGGQQSMPLEYDNTASPFYSEAERTWTTPQDWTAHGADTLLLHVRGNPVAFLERPDGTILMSGTGTNIWGTEDGFRFAYQTLRGNGSIVARVDSLVDTHESAKACVMIRRTLEPGSSYAAVNLTPRKGVLFTLRLRQGVAAVWGDPERPDVSTPLGADIQPPYWIKLERNGDQFSAFYSVDGMAWEPTYGTPQTIPMDGDVLIGLGVTSRQLAVPTFAEFSSVSTTGNVTGPWQVEAVGAEQPGNDPAPLYVAITDSAGRAAAVTHPDELAVASVSWQPWLIPLSEFSAAGVNMGMVETMVIGVGNRENPMPGGAGVIYIDDIQFGRPLSVAGE